MPSSILLVEDDPFIQMLLVETLTTDGDCAVQVASTIGQAQALTGGQGRSFDAVLLDVGLPDGNGRDFCTSLRGQGFAGPILLLSGQSHEDDIVNGLNAGADDYLVKPFGLGELLARLAALLRHAPPQATPGMVGFKAAA